MQDFFEEQRRTDKGSCSTKLAADLKSTGQEDGNLVLGFVMGYFKQYDDIVGYTLEEIVIAFEHQNKGIGSALLQEIERQVRERGASCVELQAVLDERHERYYGKAGYRNASNFVMKVKWLS